MVRLVLEENGKRRAFRVGTGVLTLGSGSSASLRLEDSGVAELYAELEVVEDRIQVRLQPDVTPAMIDGETVLGEVALHQGQGMHIGEAFLWIEDEALTPGEGRPKSHKELADGSAGRSAGSTSKPAKIESSKSRGGSRRRSSSGARKRSASRAQAFERVAESGAGQANRSGVQRSRPRGKRGLPTALVLGLLGAGLLVAGFAIMKGFKISQETAVSTDPTLAAAEKFVSEARYFDAEESLGIINLDRLTPQQKSRMEAIRTEIADGRQFRIDALEASKGTDWYTRLLENYESSVLQGNPTKAQIRLFLERCQEFRSRWPKHEEMAWVDKHEARFEGAVDLSEPLNLKDIEWQADLILRGTPRRYKLAFRMIEAFLADSGTNEYDADVARRLLKKIKVDRLEQFEENMLWSKHFYEQEDFDNRDERKAVQYLVYTVAFMDEPDMEAKALEYLLRMPNLEGHLAAYKETRPDVFELLIENEGARAQCAEFGLL